MDMKKLISFSYQVIKYLFILSFWTWISWIYKLIRWGMVWIRKFFCCLIIGEYCNLNIYTDSIILYHPLSSITIALVSVPLTIFQLYLKSVLNTAFYPVTSLYNRNTQQFVLKPFLLVFILYRFPTVLTTGSCFSLFMVFKRISFSFKRQNCLVCSIYLLQQRDTCIIKRTSDHNKLYL